jgi:hypothetical protein
LSDGVLGQSDWTQDFIAANWSSRALKRDQALDDLVGTVLFLSSSDSVMR